MLTLPTRAEGADAFTTRLASVLANPTTRAYVDTSFLTWMTRIGSPARTELTRWLSGLCGPRLKVPVWAAHEYYRHHTQGTIVGDLNNQLEALERTVAGTYSLIWPLLDETLGGAPSAPAQQAQVRDILRDVRGIANLVRDWIPNYERHAREVIEFANAHALIDSRVPAYFETLDAVADARFTGRVPPGFKDRWKKERKDQADESGALVGSNWWGDFVFWREVLDDAHRRHARQVVLLTRDGKNDWRAAGQLPTDPPSESDKSVPPAHPFLAFEAALEAGVDEVLMVNDTRLASLAQLTAESETRAFVFVARAPSLPSPKTMQERRQDAERHETAVRGSVRSAMASAEGVQYLDPIGFQAPKAVLKRALLESRSTGTTPTPVLEFEAELEHPGKELIDLLTETKVVALGGLGLVHWARRLSSRAHQSGELSSVVSDLVRSLRRFPPKVAGALYFGLIADAYLDPHENIPRMAPRSVALQGLFSCQTEVWALTPIQTLLERLVKSERIPLYLPDPLAPRIKVFCHAHGDQEPPTQLRTIRVKGLDLISPSQGDPAMQLLVRLDGEPASPHVLLEHAAEVYGLPINQLDLESDVDTVYELDQMVGFKSPNDVWVDPQEQR